jgi:hypothetical protein
MRVIHRTALEQIYMEATEKQHQQVTGLQEIRFIMIKNQTPVNVFGIVTEQVDSSLPKCVSEMGQWPK